MTRDQDGRVAVVFSEEAGPLFGLPAVGEEHPAARGDEVLQEPRGRPPVEAGIVALRGLNRGSDLDNVHVPRLRLGLDEDLDTLPAPAGEDSEDADLGLMDDGLLDDRPMPGVPGSMDRRADPHYRKESAHLVAKDAFVHPPAADPPHRDGTAFHPAGPAPLGEQRQALVAPRGDRRRGTRPDPDTNGGAVIRHRKRSSPRRWRPQATHRNPRPGALPSRCGAGTRSPCSVPSVPARAESGGNRGQHP